MKPSISIVTPVFNAAHCLRSLHENLCRQTLSEWEWVVVDDGSSDGSSTILDDIMACDKRVKVFHQTNSGAAKMPRDRAVYESSAPFIVPIDSDDIIDDNYLETITKRQKETDADIVYPIMQFMRRGKLQLTLPLDTVDTSRIYSGREALLLTIPQFEIGCNGGMYRRRIWVNSSYPSYAGRKIYMNSDEVDERLYLLEAERVAFCTARYQYILHPESITNQIKPNRFDVLDTDMQLLNIVKDEYGRQSEAYTKAERKAFLGFRNMMRLYMEHYDDFSDARDVITGKLRRTFHQLANIHLPMKERMQFLGMKSFRAVFLMTSVKYRGVKGFIL